MPVSFIWWRLTWRRVRNSSGGMKLPRSRPARPRQHRQPFGVAGVGLAPRHLLDVLGVDHRGLDARLFQCRIRAFPVDAGAFHDHDVGLEARDPFGHGVAVALEAAELAAVHDRLAPQLGDNDANAEQGQVNVYSYGATVDGLNVHGSPPLLHKC